MIVALVPARAGSKGLPGKNTLALAGEPLWRRAALQGARCADRAIVSSDIAGIADAMPTGVELHPRPAALAGDAVTMAELIAHLVEACDLGGATLLLLQPTSPLRSDADIAAVLGLREAGGYPMALTVTESDRTILKQGTLDGDRFVPLSAPEHCFANRQALPPTYRPNGAVYAFSEAAFTAAGGFPAARIGAVAMPAERSLDIDRAEDYEAAVRALEAAA